MKEKKKSSYLLLWKGQRKRADRAVQFDWCCHYKTKAEVVAEVPFAFPLKRWTGRGGHWEGAHRATEHTAFSVLHREGIEGGKRVLFTGFTWLANWMHTHTQNATGTYPRIAFERTQSLSMAHWTIHTHTSARNHIVSSLNSLDKTFHKHSLAVSADRLVWQIFLTSEFV